MHIKILGPGCVNCDLVERRVWRALCEARIAAIVEKVTEDDGWQRYLQMATPGLVVNDTLVCAGRIPDKQEISRWIASARDRNEQAAAHPAGEG